MNGHAQSGTTESSTEGCRATVFIIEDDLDISDYLSILLRRGGFDVVGRATSREEAVEFLLAKQPDLIFMDIGLRGDVDGIETAAEIKRRQDIPIVYLTGYTDHRTMQRLKITKPAGIVYKPFTGEDIEQAAFRALHLTAAAEQQSDHPDDNGLGGLEQEEELFAAIGRMMGVMAHEMRSPITAALIKIEMLQSDLPPLDDRWEELESITQELLRLRDIVKENLDLTNIVHLNLKPVGLPELLASVQRRFSTRLADRAMQFTASVPNLKVLVDSPRIRTVLQQLVSHSLDVMKNGGTIKIRAEADAKKGVACIHIEDTGPGIDNPERCLRSFHSTKQWGPGLGLSPVRRVAEAHGGGLELVSTGADGTIFLLTLPLASERNYPTWGNTTITSQFPSHAVEDFT